RSGRRKRTPPTTLRPRSTPTGAGPACFAVAGAFGVVNAVSLYVEHGKDTFHAVHVAAAERLANEARKARVERLVQISDIRDRGRCTVGVSLHPCAWAGRAGGPQRLCRGQGDPASCDVRPR